MTIFWSTVNALATALGWLSMVTFAAISLALLGCLVRDVIANRRHEREDLQNEIHWHHRIRQAKALEVFEAEDEMNARLYDQEADA